MVELAACLAAGNTVVLKPASATAQTGLAIGELCRRAGLPPGVVNVVTASGADVDRLLEHPGVAKILFTGSVETGCHVMRKASKNVTPFVLELGGKDAAVVAADADLDRTASGLVWGAFANAGQACGSIERVYAVRSVADELIAKVVAKTRRLRQGDPLAEATDVGPMTTAEQRDFVDAQVREAVAQGARALTGGEKPVAKGYWFPPTVLVDVNHGMRVMREETFGPVLPIVVVDNLDEAITLANDSEFGLTASGWTRSTKTAQKLVEELRAGTVTINDHLFSFGEPTATWGGLGKSGIGRSHGVHGLMELVNVKHVSVDLQDSSAAPWWYPYDGAFQEFMKKAFGLLYARDARTKMTDGLGLLVERAVLRLREGLEDRDEAREGVLSRTRSARASLESPRGGPSRPLVVPRPAGDLPLPRREGEDPLRREGALDPQAPRLVLRRRAEAPEDGGAPRRVRDDRHGRREHRERGARPRERVHQEAQAPVQHPAPGRQDLPVHQGDDGGGVAAGAT